MVILISLSIGFLFSANTCFASEDPKDFELTWATMGCTQKACLNLDMAIRQNFEGDTTAPLGKIREHEISIHSGNRSDSKIRPVSYLLPIVKLFNEHVKDDDQIVPISFTNWASELNDSLGGLKNYKEIKSLVQNLFNQNSKQSTISFFKNQNPKTKIFGWYVWTKQQSFFDLYTVKQLHP